MRNALTTLLLTNSRKSFKSFVKKAVSFLDICTNEKFTSHGNALHCQLIKLGFSSQKYIAVRLLIMYLDSKNVRDIDHMLKEFDGFNLVVHNCLINSNMERGNTAEARRLFDEMPERNEVTWTSLVSGLLKHGKICEAMRYFEMNPFSDVFSWTATISGLVHNRLNFEAMELYKKMLRSGILPNDVSFTCVLKACEGLGDLELGKGLLGSIIKFGFDGYLSICNSLITLYLRLGKFDYTRMIFAKMEKRDVVSWTAILDMHVEMGNMEEARRVFELMPERNEVSWSAMIARLSQCGNFEEAVHLFRQMIKEKLKPNFPCYSCVIVSLAGLKALHAGMSIHSHVYKTGMSNDVYIGSSLIDFYSKCGNTRDGRSVFDSLSHKNVVCWNSMVACYSLNRQLAEAEELFEKVPKKNNISWNSIVAGHVEIENFEKAFELFKEMISSAEMPNKSTFSSVLRACASLASLEKGRYSHAWAIKLGFQGDIFVGTALVDMYAKSGSIESSKTIFRRMPSKNEIVWTAMIQGLAENGLAKESLSLFEEMEQQTSPIAPNELMLSSVLFACSHCGLVDKGLKYFNSMEKVYGIKHNERHYTSVVDMLSRSGRIQEAEKFIARMPYKADANTWAALLNGCNKYRDGEELLVEKTAYKLAEMVDEKPGGLVLLSNIYAYEGRWLDVLSTRELMSRKGFKKSGGCSWIEVRNRVHSFFSQDESHPQTYEIYTALQMLNAEIQAKHV